MNDRSLVHALFAITIIVSVIAIAFNVVAYKEVSRIEDYYVERLETANNSCSMRFPEKSLNGIEGVYSHPNYYCVWTKDMTPYEIAETTFHELAHYYSFHAPEHFNVDWENETHKWQLEEK